MRGYAYEMARLCDGVQDAWEGPSFFIVLSGQAELASLGFIVRI